VKCIEDLGRKTWR